MGLTLTVQGEKVNFTLTDYEIRGYDFTFKAPNSKYAKSPDDERCLKITGDLSRILEKNKEVLEVIRTWGKTEYKDKTYYNSVKITETYREEVIREITFPDAFIKEFKEEINPHTGHGYFTLLLKQKFDKRIDIIVDPFNEKFPKMSDMMNPESDINKLAALTGLSAAVVGAMLLNPGLFPHAGIQALLNGTGCYSKDPVNLATGNFIYANLDISVEGAFPIEFVRFYNAIDDYDGMLGHNWHNSFEIKSVNLEDGSKEIIFDDGHREKYTPNEDGSYNPPAGVYNRLLPSSNSNEEDTYSLTFKDGSKYEFDKDGNISLKADVNGNETNFAYENNLLTNVYTLSGSFMFSYDSDGLVNTITDHAGRSVTYKYADGNIWRFTDALGHTTKYAYDTDNRLVSMTNSLGNIMVHNTYDNNSRTEYQGFPDGGSMGYVYSDTDKTTNLTERNGNKIIYHYDEDHRIYKEEFTDGSIEKVFDAENNLTQYTDKVGNTWNYEYDANGNRVKSIDHWETPQNTNITF